MTSHAAVGDWSGRSDRTDTADWCFQPPKPRNVVQVAHPAEWRQRSGTSNYVEVVPVTAAYDADALKYGVMACLIIELAGILLLTTGVVLGPALIAGVGLASLYLGCSVLVGSLFLNGLHTGIFVISPRSSVIAIIVFVGLAVTTTIAALEVTFF